MEYIDTLNNNNQALQFQLINEDTNEEWREILFPKTVNRNNQVKIGQRLGLPFVRSLQPSIKVKLPNSAYVTESDETIEIFQDGSGVMGISGVVWDCALYFVDYLLSNMSQIQRHRVLDLGSGTGLCGIGMLYLGSDYVLFSDSFLNESLERNLESLPESLKSRSHFQPYLWGEGEVPPIIRSNNDGSPWDLVICSDLLYESKNHAALLSVLNQISYSLIIFSYKKRHDKEEEIFFEELTKTNEINVIDPKTINSFQNISVDAIDSGLFLITARRRK